jgi:hypothetical protein
MKRSSFYFPTNSINLYIDVYETSLRYSFFQANYHQICGFAIGEDAKHLRGVESWRWISVFFNTREYAIISLEKTQLDSSATKIKFILSH